MKGSWVQVPFSAFQKRSSFASQVAGVFRSAAWYLPFPCSKIIFKYHNYISRKGDGASLFHHLFFCYLFSYFFCNCSVPSQLRAKMHLKSPSVMAFWLACLGILAKNMPKRLAGYCLLNSYFLLQFPERIQRPFYFLRLDAVSHTEISRAAEGIARY